MGQGLFYEKPWVVISPTLTSLGVMVSCYPDTQVGGNWAAGGGGGRVAGFTCSTRLMAALFPVALWPADITERQCVQGAQGCRNCRQHEGSCEVQRWGCLSPLGFTHPLSIKCVSPLSFSLCACVF